MVRRNPTSYVLEPQRSVNVTVNTGHSGGPSVPTSPNSSGRLDRFFNILPNLHPFFTNGDSNFLAIQFLAISTYQFKMGIFVEIARNGFQSSPGRPKVSGRHSPASGSPKRGPLANQRWLVNQKIPGYHVAMGSSS